MTYTKRIDQLRVYLTGNHFSLQEVKTRPRTLLLLMIASYLFAIAVRYVWAMQYRGQSELFWNGYLMLNTTDGYHWAEKTHDLLTNGYQWVDFNALPALTALIINLCSCPLEAVMQYLPVFFGSLIVVPLVLIGHALRQPLIGFIAALYAVIAWSYFNRTLPGYFDTDMLNVVFPMFIVWGCIDWLLRKRIYLALFVPMLLAGYGLWYPSSASLNSAILLMVLLYTLVFDRRSLLPYKFLALCALAAMSLPVWWKLNGILLLWWFYFGRYSQLPARMVLGVSWLVILLWIGLDFAEPILSKVGRYGFHTESLPDTLSNISSNVTALDMTLEAQRIPLQDIGLRVSGHLALFIVGGVGYLLLLLRFPVMIVSLPMVALGLSAYFTGLRFTIYAVPLFALGMAFFVVLVGRAFIRLDIPVVGKYVYPSFVVLCTGLALYPNLIHALTYTVETVLERDEVEALDRLKEISSNDDFVITWWDFGYPTKYYANRHTLVDGGQNRFNQLFPVGYVLTAENQVAAANMARISVDDAFQEERPSTERILKKHGYSELSTFLSELEKLSHPVREIKPEIYIYIPDKMLETFGLAVLIVDSNRAEYEGSPFYWYYESVKQTAESELTSDLGSLRFDEKKGIIISNEVTIHTKRFLRVNRKDKSNEIETTLYNPGLKHTVIYLENEETMFVVDERVFNSLVMRLAIREDYDETLFEPVIRTRKSRVYKVLK